MAVKKGTYKVDNGDGTFVDIMLKTTAEQVILNDGRSVQQVFGKKNKLWTGAWVLAAGHKARLSKNIKDTPNGLILRWSAYTNGIIRDYNWCETIVSKDEWMIGMSRELTMTNSRGIQIVKTIYITDGGMALIGHDNNDTGESHAMVLREIVEF
ncbi:hypothetical protein K5V21_06055 [Clostridium sardiniense]|uniref:Uncharacterized protein n=1 Tax=Clostridium sardiniense TaxID=29369 RepID=A0ABS7KWR4_CLOSR|nr:hypothetical protein [Clostridium sardiniense]MBY0755017.1 hypothetical protein [Clostridium sardiniense]MDQ0459129.1 hypothetical protein [Clostridium sardiniense]